MTDTAPISPQPDGGWVLVRRTAAPEVLERMVTHALTVSLGDGHTWRDYMCDLYRMALSASPTPSDEDWERMARAEHEYLNGSDGNNAWPKQGARYHERRIAGLKAAFAALGVHP